MRMIKVLNKLSVYRGHINKGLSLMLVGNILSTLLNIVIVKLLTNKLSVADFGFYSLAMSFAGLPQIVLFAPLTAAIFPFFKKRKDKGDYQDFQKEIFDIFFFINIVLAVTFLLVMLLNNYYNFYSSSISLLFFLTLIFSSSISALSILDSFSLADSRTREFVIFPVINLALKIFIIIAFFYVTLSVDQIIFAFSVVQVVLFCSEFYFLKKIGVVGSFPRMILRDVVKINTPNKKEVLMYANNFFIWGVFAWLQGFADKWILHTYAPVNDVAIYSVYFQYGFFPFTVFSSVISQYITPKYFSKLGMHDELYHFMNKLLIGTIVFLTLSLIFLPMISYYISPFLVKILTNSRYLEHIQYFPYIVAGGCFYCFAQILAVPLLNADLVRQVRLPKVASSVLAVILFGVMVPRFKILGIIIPLIIINIFYFVAIFIANYRYFLNLKEIVAGKKYA